MTRQMPFLLKTISLISQGDTRVTNVKRTYSRNMSVAKMYGSEPKLSFVKIVSISIFKHTQNSYCQFLPPASYNTELILNAFSQPSILNNRWKISQPSIVNNRRKICTPPSFCVNKSRSFRVQYKSKRTLK